MQEMLRLAFDHTCTWSFFLLWMGRVQRATWRGTKRCDDRDLTADSSFEMCFCRLFPVPESKTPVRKRTSNATHLKIVRYIVQQTGTSSEIRSEDNSNEEVPMKSTELLCLLDSRRCVRYCKDWWVKGWWVNVPSSRFLEVAR